MKPGKCKYFNGIQNERCDADYIYLDVAAPLTREQIDWHNQNYPEFDLERSAIGVRIPCFAENGVGGCPGYCEPTPEEIEAYNADIDAYIAKFLPRMEKTREAIVEYIVSQGAKDSDFGGMIPCVICDDGTVEFGYAGAYNGHISARCSTPGCIEWVE